LEGCNLRQIYTSKKGIADLTMCTGEKPFERAIFERIEAEKV
jgi:hypothetical protein